MGLFLPSGNCSALAAEKVKRGVSDVPRVEIGQLVGFLEDVAAVAEDWVCLLSYFTR